MYSFLFFRIWGSFGQKLLEETKIYILSKESEPNSFITRTMTLLKISGLRNISSLNDLKIVSDYDSIIFIDWDIYKEFKLKVESVKCPKIVYKNLSFRTIFPKRLCKIGSHCEYCIYCFYI